MTRTNEQQSGWAFLARACLCGALGGFSCGAVLATGLVLLPPRELEPLLASLGSFGLALALVPVPLALALVGIAIGPVLAIHGGNGKAATR